MSWHVTKTIEGGSAEDELETLRAEVISQNPDGEGQFEAAKDAVHALLASGQIGGPERRYHVTMSGHANPGHEPRDGWATDTITVNVSQA